MTCDRPRGRPTTPAKPIGMLWPSSKGWPPASATSRSGRRSLARTTCRTSAGQPRFKHEMSIVRPRESSGSALLQFVQLPVRGMPVMLRSPLRRLGEPIIRRVARQGAHAEGELPDQQGDTLKWGCDIGFRWSWSARQWRLHAAHVMTCSVGRVSTAPSAGALLKAGPHRSHQSRAGGQPFFEALGSPLSPSRSSD